MLSITQKAAEAIRRMVLRSPLGEEAGLRISLEQLDEEVAGLELSIVETPSDEDQVVAQRGAKIFLESDAAAFLEDKTLDARVQEEGIEFTISQQQQDAMADDWSQNGHAGRRPNL